MSLAMIEVRTIASVGFNGPYEVILRPYRCPFQPKKRKIPEKTVEKIHRMITVMESEVNRAW